MTINSWLKRVERDNRRFERVLRKYIRMWREGFPVLLPLPFGSLYRGDFPRPLECCVKRAGGKVRHVHLAAGYLRASFTVPRDWREAGEALGVLP